MKKMILNLGLILGLIGISMSSVASDELEMRKAKDEINLLTNKINETIWTTNLNLDQLKSLKMQLENALNGLTTSPSDLICAKSSNGRFFPFDKKTGRAVGSTEWQAGHDELNLCKETLPLPGETMTCYKISNGRYYPVNAKTGQVMGSVDWQAGYDVLKECRNSLK